MSGENPQRGAQGGEKNTPAPPGYCRGTRQIQETIKPPPPKPGVVHMKDHGRMNTAPVRCDGSGSITITEARVYDSGKFTIPKNTRERHDITQDDIFDVRVTTDEETFTISDANIVNAGGKHFYIRVPVRQRKLYDINDGDYLDAELVQTGGGRS